MALNDLGGKSPFDFSRSWTGAKAYMLPWGEELLIGSKSMGSILHAAARLTSEPHNLWFEKLPGIGAWSTRRWGDPLERKQRKHRSLAEQFSRSAVLFFNLRIVPCFQVTSSFCHHVSVRDILFCNVYENGLWISSEFWLQYHLD